MTTIVIVVLLAVVLLGGGGYYGRGTYRADHGNAGVSIVGLLVLLLVVFLVLKLAGFVG